MVHLSKWQTNPHFWWSLLTSAPDSQRANCMTRHIHGIMSDEDEKSVKKCQTMSSIICVEVTFHSCIVHLTDMQSLIARLILTRAIVCVEEMSAGASFNAAPASAHRALQQFACFRKLTMNPDTKPQLKDAMHLLVALTLAVHSHATCGVCFQFLSHCMCLKVLKAPFQKSNFHEPIPAWAAWETHECIVWNWTSWGGEDDCVLQLVWQSFAEMTLRWFEFSSIMHGCMFRCKSLKCRRFHCWNIVLSQWNVQTSLEWRKCSLPAKNHLWCSKLLNVVLCGAHMRPGTHCRNVAHVRVSSA